MVEMALVMPILLFIALGIVDFGRAINYWNDANKLATDCARHPALYHNPGDDNGSSADDDFRNWIRLQADSSELQDGTIASPTAPSGREDSAATPRGLHICVGKPGQATPAEGDLAVGKPIEVVVETSYNLIPFIGEETDFGQVKIGGSATMRLEQPYTMETGCVWSP